MEWVGVNLDSHRFLLCSATSELLSTCVNAEKKKEWFTAPLCTPRPFPGWDSSHWGNEGRFESRSARPLLVLVRKIHNSECSHNIIRSLTLCLQLVNQRQKIGLQVWIIHSLLLLLINLSVTFCEHWMHSMSGCERSYHNNIRDWLSSLVQRPILRDQSVFLFRSPLVDIPVPDIETSWMCVWSCS